MMAGGHSDVKTPAGPEDPIHEAISEKARSEYLKVLIVQGWLKLFCGCI